MVAFTGHALGQPSLMSRTGQPIANEMAEVALLSATSPAFFRTPAQRFGDQSVPMRQRDHLPYAEKKKGRLLPAPS